MGAVLLGALDSLSEDRVLGTALHAVAGDGGFHPVGGKALAGIEAGGDVLVDLKLPDTGPSTFSHHFQAVVGAQMLLPDRFEIWALAGELSAEVLQGFTGLGGFSGEGEGEGRDGEKNQGQDDDSTTGCPVNRSTLHDLILLTSLLARRPDKEAVEERRGFVAVKDLSDYSSE